MRYGGLWAVPAVGLVVAGYALMDRAGEEMPRASAACLAAIQNAADASDRAQRMTTDAFVSDAERARAKAEADDALVAVSTTYRGVNTAIETAGWAVNVGGALQLLGWIVALGAFVCEVISLARAHRAASTPA